MTTRFPKTDPSRQDNPLKYRTSANKSRSNQARKCRSPEANSATNIFHDRCNQWQAQPCAFGPLGDKTGLPDLINGVGWDARSRIADREECERLFWLRTSWRRRPHGRPGTARSMNHSQAATTLTNTEDELIQTLTQTKPQIRGRGARYIMASRSAPVSRTVACVTEKGTTAQTAFCAVVPDRVDIWRYSVVVR